MEIRASGSKCKMEPKPLFCLGIHECMDLLNKTFSGVLVGRKFFHNFKLMHVGYKVEFWCINFDVSCTR